VNLYLPLGNAPINQVDPWGLCCVDSITGYIRTCMAKPTVTERIKCLEAVLAAQGTYLSEKDLATLTSAIRNLKALEHHLSNMRANVQRIKQLRDALRGRLTAKQRDQLQKQLEKEIDAMYGHAKEIRQRWGVDSMKELEKDVLTEIRKHVREDFGKELDRIIKAMK
jgi:DNA mismatch repair ATPase MutS